MYRDDAIKLSAKPNAMVVEYSENGEWLLERNLFLHISNLSSPLILVILFKIR